MKLLCLLFLGATCLALAEGVMVCYFGSWAKYRWGDGTFDVENIDPAICTHIVFGFAGIDEATHEIQPLDPYNELCENWGKCAYDRFTALKEKNTNLQALLAVGGWNEGSEKYSVMAADSAKRKIFIDSSIALLKAHNFDGLDMDWEYPAFRGGQPHDRENFVTLLQELREALHAEGMIITAAVGAGKDKMDEGYDIARVAANLDFVNLMTYDLHGAWDPYTHHHSPLYAHPQDRFNNNSYLNVDFAVNYWLDHGTPKEKLVVGVPLYGRCWTLDSEADTGFYAKASQPGTAGKYTNQAGFMGYNEICESQLEKEWQVVYDTAMHEPYAYSFSHSRIWCSYEDALSAGIKAKYIRDKGLAGVMIWSIETDDFKGKCHGRTFHLTKTLYETFLGGDIPQPPTMEPKPQTTLSPDVSVGPRTTYNPPPPEGICQRPGNNPDPEDCTHYFQCAEGPNGKYEQAEEKCPAGLLFNPVALICDWDYSVCALDGNVCPNNC
ncbi:chitinase-3-like protein 1 [Macrobrachium rosenbergii]|uniref:chitinase-3-like protein 1 n=1 Tax=Macrobrachium rosenbergii TaxID=79674 RepID=UPI0034D73581